MRKNVVPTNDALIQAEADVFAKAELLAFTQSCEYGVMRHAMEHLALLSAMEATCSRLAPHRQRDFQRIVDEYTEHVLSRFGGSPGGGSSWD